MAKHFVNIFEFIIDKNHSIFFCFIIFYIISKYGPT